MKCILHVRNEVYVTINGLKNDHVTFLWDAFAPYVDGYRHMPMYKLGRWDGRVRFYEKTGKTYVRLLPRIIPQLESWGYEIDIIDDRLYYQPPALINSSMFEHRHGFTLRPYQVQAINLGIENSGGFLLLGTGAGKTPICAALSHSYSSMGYDTITIVPSADLVKQTAKTYRFLGLDTGIFSGDEKDIHHMNVVATWQSIQNNFKILSKFKCVIWDESHGAKANVAQQILNEHMMNAPFKFGVTGTFPKAPADQMSLNCAIGDILIEVKVRWLIDNGYLAEIDIRQVLIKQKGCQDFSDYSAERSFLAKNELRTDTIADLIIAKAGEFGNTLVLVNSIPFGQNLADIIEGATFLYGGSHTDDRNEQYSMYETQDDMIVIATAGIASTGISIDRIKCLIIIDAGKSFIRAIQTVGRGTRLAADKRKVVVFDVFADLKWSKAHSRERAKWYKDAEYPITNKHIIKI